VNSTTVSDSTVFEGRTYFYQAYSGTSMACPFVTGAVALMLQKQPDLTPGLVKRILRETAITDSLTGRIPPQGTNDYGWGRLNVLDAIKRTISLNSELKKQRSKYFIYPNPVGSYLTISSVSNDNEIFTLSITDMLGRKVGEYTGYTNETLNLENQGFKAGAYLLKLKTASSEENLRMVKQ